MNKMSRKMLPSAVHFLNYSSQTIWHIDAYYVYIWSVDLVVIKQKKGDNVQKYGDLSVNVWHRITWVVKDVCVCLVSALGLRVAQKTDRIKIDKRRMVYIESSSQTIVHTQ